MITVYSSPTCAPCKSILYWLDKKGHKYEYKLLEDHMEEASQYTNQLFPPVVVIDGQVAKNISEVARLLG
jgi:glutaredoxin